MHRLPVAVGSFSLQMYRLGHRGALLRRPVDYGAVRCGAVGRVLEPLRRTRGGATVCVCVRASARARPRCSVDGRSEPKGTAARKRLQLHSGCLEGGMTPTGAKEEEGSVWRRKEKGYEEGEEEEEEKTGSKPDKASEKVCADSRWRDAEKSEPESR